MNKNFQLILLFFIFFNEISKAMAGVPSKTPTSNISQESSDINNSDYIKKAKDSYIDMLNKASIKYKSGKITKEQYQKIAKQVNKMIDYYKNVSATSSNSPTTSATRRSAISDPNSNALEKNSPAPQSSWRGKTDSSLGICTNGDPVDNSLGGQAFSLTCTNGGVTSTHVAYWNVEKKACGFFDDNKFKNVDCPSFIKNATAPSVPNPMYIHPAVSAPTAMPEQLVANNSSIKCDELKAFNSTGVDSSKTLQSCFDKTPNGETLFLPKGKYTIINEVIIKHPMKLTTLDASSNKCSPDEDHGCVELKAGPETFTKIGFFKVLSKDVTIDHIVINGNRQERYKSPAAEKCKIGPDNTYGMNDQFVGDNITITNSVFKNALCGTGLYLISGSGFNITNNTVTSNGIHDQENFWSDGLTALEILNSKIINNLFSDNTDVDLILGACPNCTIQSNLITHSNSFTSSSFAAIMIQAWPNIPSGGTTGNYTGADISNNNVNCSVGQRCGIGLYVGQSAWYEANTYGGNVHDNTVVGAQQGFAVDKVKNFSIANNQVSGSQGTFETSCGKKYFSAFVITPGTVVDRSKDLIPDFHYLSFKLEGCIPNWWKHPY